MPRWSIVSASSFLTSHNSSPTNVPNVDQSCGLLVNSKPNDQQVSYRLVLDSGSPGSQGSSEGYLLEQQGLNFAIGTGAVLPGIEVAARLLRPGGRARIR